MQNMKVPRTVLQNLVCDNCENYLSRGPILMLDDGTSRCGRCVKPEDDAKRNKPYEELAKLMTFPCKYRENGCEEKIAFQDNQEHEEACAYRLYLCPIAESGHCYWSGTRDDVLEHCRLIHPASVIENPAKLKHDITKSNFCNYILFVFHTLFLVQTKVCTVTKKIYYSIRLLGDPSFAFMYTYDVEITNKKGKIIKHGTVVAQGCLALQEDTAMTVNINGLLSVLGDFKDTVFVVTLRSIEAEMEITTTGKDNETEKRDVDVQRNIWKNWKKTMASITGIKIDGKKQVITENNTKAKELTTTNRNAKENKVNTQVICNNSKCLTKSAYRNHTDWLCWDCVPNIVSCSNSVSGCTFKDIPIKCKKHEWYFCRLTTRCKLCDQDINEDTLMEHYSTTHYNITFRAGTVYHNMPINDKLQTFIINDDFCTVCEYYLNSSLFFLEMYTSLLCEHLCLYKCKVEISHPVTGHVLSRTANVEYSRDSDWLLSIPLPDISYLHNTTRNIKVTFIKNES